MDAGLLNFENKKKKKKALNDTIRLKVDLFQPTKEKCPEFDFCELVKEKTGKDIIQDPLEECEEIQKLKQIAKKFEEKYGPKKDKHGKKYNFGKPEDYLDLGMGYDKNDPFIDDTEEYDELLPSTMTTKFGGFYVNRGAIEYRQIDDSSNSDDDSSLDSEPKKKKVRLKENGTSVNISTSGGRTNAKKKRPGIPNLVNKRRKLDKQNGIRKKCLTPNQKAGSALVKNSRNILARKFKKSNVDELTPHREKHVDDVVSLVATGDATKIDLSIESTINEMLEDSLAKRRNLKNEKEFNLLMDVSKSDSESEETMRAIEDFECEKGQSSSEDSARLKGRPPTLHSTVKRKKSFSIPIEVQKLVSKTSEEKVIDPSGKCKLTPAGDKLLQDLFALINRFEFNQLQRSGIVNEVSNRTGISKNAILNRYKRWSSTESGQKSPTTTSTSKKTSFNELLTKLQNEVKAIMPRLEAEHARASEVAAEKKLEILNSPSASSAVNKMKNVYSPRRKFHWTTETRSHLAAIARSCHEKYVTSNPMSPPEAFERFMDETVVPKVLHCFPPNWMTGKPVMKMFREVCPFLFPKQESPLPLSARSSSPFTTNAETTSNTEDAVASSSTKASSSSKADFTIDSVLTSRTTSPLTSNNTTANRLARRSTSDDIPLHIDIITPPPRSDSTAIRSQDHRSAAEVIKNLPAISRPSVESLNTKSQQKSSGGQQQASSSSSTSKVIAESKRTPVSAIPQKYADLIVSGGLQPPPQEVMSSADLKKQNLLPTTKSLEHLKHAVSAVCSKSDTPTASAVDVKPPSVRKSWNATTSGEIAAMHFVSQSMGALNRGHVSFTSNAPATNEQLFRTSQHTATTTVSAKNKPPTSSPISVTTPLTSNNAMVSRTISPSKSSTTTTSATAAINAHVSLANPIRSETTVVSDHLVSAKVGKNQQQQSPIPKLATPASKTNEHSAFKSPLVSPPPAAINVANTKTVAPVNSVQKSSKTVSPAPKFAGDISASPSFVSQKMPSGYTPAVVSSTASKCTTNVLSPHSSISPLKQQVPKTSPISNSAAYSQLTMNQFYNYPQASQANPYYNTNYFLPSSNSYCNDFHAQFASTSNSLQELQQQQLAAYQSSLRMSSQNQSSQSRSASYNQQNQGYNRTNSIHLPPPNNLHNP